MIVDPWGRIVAEAGHDEPGIVIAEIDTARVAAGAQEDPQPEERARFRVASVAAAQPARSRAAS